MDYAAATPVNNEVHKAMQPYWQEHFANASSIHREGVKVKMALEEARESVARTLRVRADDIIFTSGGTEGNNLALRGAVAAMRKAGVAAGDIEIISTMVEHPSIMKALDILRSEGCVVTYAPIDEEGRIKIDEFTDLLSPKTRIVSIAYANSETGVVQDLGKIGRIIKSFERENGLQVIFHTDACQAPLWLPCALDALNVDMMTLDAGKCEGPKGVGVLVKRRPVSLSAVIQGGGQEGGFRPGTEPVALIVGCAKAIELAQKNQVGLAKRVRKLRDKWVKGLLKISGVVLNGSLEHRLPNNVNISIPGFDSEYAVISLDAAGIACSTKSACSGAGSGRSQVVFEMTKDEARAGSTIRFSLGPNTSWRDLVRTAKVLRQHEIGMKEFLKK